MEQPEPVNQARTDQLEQMRRLIDSWDFSKVAMRYDSEVDRFTFLFDRDHDFFINKLTTDGLYILIDPRNQKVRGLEVENFAKGFLQKYPKAAMLIRDSDLSHPEPEPIESGIGRIKNRVRHVVKNLPRPRRVSERAVRNILGEMTGQLA